MFCLDATRLFTMVGYYGFNDLCGFMYRADLPKVVSIDQWC